MPTPPQSALIQRAIIAETAGWTDQQRAALLHRLNREATRLTIKAEYPSAGLLACAIDPSTVQTPALHAVDNALEWAFSTRDARLAISFPPQEGKTTRVGTWGVLRALIQNPERRIVLASYSDYLARTTSRHTRNIIKEHGSEAQDPLTGTPLPDRLGLALADDKAAASSWQLAGHKGGLYAVGVGGSLTGQPADVIIIDDPLKGMAEADSKIERDNVIGWWEAVAQTRLAPGAPVIIIQTRWHEDDLVGHVLEQDRVRGEDTWRVVNVPAIATPGVVDTLGREPGVAMVSARGRTQQDFERIRQDVGERVWAALYLGTPTPAQGGLFSAEWFDRYRAPTLPDGVAATIVSVDPAETGHRDEAGIVGVSVTGDGRAWVTDDRSGRMQSDEWARTAVLLACEVAAGEVLFEAFTTGPTYERVIVDAWRRVRDEKRMVKAAGGDIAAALEEYVRREDCPENPTRALVEVRDVPVPDQQDPPFRIRPWRARGDKVARAAGARQAASTGRLRMVGTHPVLESQAVSWQQGQSSPDRMDALVNGFERAMQLVGAQSQIATPTPAGPQEGVGVSAPVMGGFWSSRVG